MSEPKWICPRCGTLDPARHLRVSDGSHCRAEVETRDAELSRLWAENARLRGAIRCAANELGAGQPEPEGP